MKRGKELRSNFLSRNARFDYLTDNNRYLFAIDKPKYRFNIIGAGIIGHEHIRLTLLEGRATVHGIFDPNPSSIAGAKTEYEKYAVSDDSLVIYDSLEQACHDPEVDGLIICTPNYTHLEIVKEAVKSGKHIMLEKPMATTIQDAYEITRLANRYEAIFQIGLQYRYKAIYVEAIHEALERQTIGNIKTISMVEHRPPFLDKVGQWNKFSKYSGGTLVEKCCHYFDLLNLFAQARPARVFATGSMAVNFQEFEYGGEKSDIIDHAFVIVTYENGVQARFDLCMFSPTYYEEIIVCGDEGRLKAFENENFLSEPGPRTHLEIMCGEHRPARITTPSYLTHIEETGHNGSTYYEHIKFIDNIEGKETSTAKAEEGLWSVIVGVAAEQSVTSGKLVNIAELLAENGLTL